MFKKSYGLIALLLCVVLMIGCFAISTEAQSTVLLAVQGAITDGNLVKFSGVNGIGVDTGVSATSIVKSKFDATSAPTVNNDVDEGYTVGSRWLDVTNDKSYVCLDNTDGAAIWHLDIVGPGSSTDHAIVRWDGVSGRTTLDSVVTISDAGVIAGGTWNGVVVGPAYGGTGIANNAASTITISGNYAITFTVTNTTSITLPTSGILVSDVTACTDLEGTGLSITTGTLNWVAPNESIDSDAYVDASIDHEHLAPDVISGMTNVTSEDADYILIWDNTDSALKKVDMGEVRGAGAVAFTDLTDTPANYTGSANKFLQVNATPDAIIFDTISVTDVSGAATSGANINITSILNTALYIGRDVDNKIDWGTDDQLKITIAGALHSIVSITDGAGDNDKLVTQGYVDDQVSGANVNLSNLAAVAINTSLLSDAADTDDLGSATKEWRSIYVGTVGKIYLGLDQEISLEVTDANTLYITASANVSLSGGLIVGGTVALAANNITMTGSIGVTGSRVTKLWTADLECTNDITIGGTALAAIYEGIITGTDTHVMFFDGADTPGGEAGFTYIKGTDTLNVVNIACTAISGTLTGTASVAATGDAAVDFFGAGVDAVTDTTECTDIEGTLLSIATGVLNAAIPAGHIKEAMLDADAVAVGDILTYDDGGVDFLWKTKAELSIASSGANIDITSILNAALYVGRDADNTINFATDNKIIFRTSGVDNVEILATGEFDFNAFSAVFTEQALTSGTAIAWDLGNSNKTTLTAAHNFTITITAPSGAMSAQLIITQDGTGSRVMDEIITQTDATVATTDVHTDTEIVDLTVDIPTGARIRIDNQEGTDVPEPLVENTVYWAIRTSENHIQFATTKANAIAGTDIDLTDQGTGTHTVEQLVKWVSGTLGVLSTAAGAEDVLSLIYKTGDKQWYAQLGKDFY